MIKGQNFVNNVGGVKVLCNALYLYKFPENVFNSFKVI